MRTLAAALAMALLVTSCGGTEPAERDLAADAPPPLDPGDYSLWMSASTAPPDTELVAVLVNQGDGADTFGILAEVQRWEGGRWRTHRQLAMCMDHWHCTAEPVERVTDLPAIGLSPSAGGSGPIERFRTSGLDDGWYRISHTSNEGSVAAGLLQVMSGAPRPAPLAPTDVPSLSVAPPLLAGAPSTLQLFPLVPPTDGQLTGADLAAAVSGLAGAMALQRWTGLDWQTTDSVDVRTDGSDRLTRLVTVPSLADGEYRLIHGEGDRQLIGRFWVDSTATRE
ncbi:MAG: hypothetical protein AB7H43_11930 [Acidimicrobiia bacterium]